MIEKLRSKEGKKTFPYLFWNISNVDSSISSTDTNRKIMFQSKQPMTNKKYLCLALAIYKTGEKGGNRNILLSFE